MKTFLGMALVMMLILSGCGNESVQSTPANVTTTTVATTETTTTTAEATTTTEATTAEVTTTTEAAGDSLLALGFEEKDGALEYLELENSPIQGGGLRIRIYRDEAKIHMIKTDASGSDTVEYVTFHVGKNEVEKYKYVSMMGSGFYYYYNLESKELYKIENDAHEDRTESTKESGRFEGAVADVEDEIALLTAYFEGKFGPMAEAIK